MNIIFLSDSQLHVVTPQETQPSVYDLPCEKLVGAGALAIALESSAKLYPGYYLLLSDINVSSV